MHNPAAYASPENGKIDLAANPESPVEVTEPPIEVRVEPAVNLEPDYLKQRFLIGAYCDYRIREINAVYDRANEAEKNMLDQEKSVVASLRACPGYCKGLAVFVALDWFQGSRHFFDLSNLLRREQVHFTIEEKRFIDRSFQKIIAAQAQFPLFNTILDLRYDVDKDLKKEKFKPYEAEELEEWRKTLLVHDEVLIDQTSVLKGMLRHTNYQLDIARDIRLVKKNNNFYPDAFKHVEFLYATRFGEPQFKRLRAGQEMLPLQTKTSPLQNDFITSEHIFDIFKYSIREAFASFDLKKTVVLVHVCADSDDIFLPIIEKNEANISGAVGTNHAVAMSKDEEGKFIFFDSNSTRMQTHENLDLLLEMCIKPFFEEGNNGIPRAVFGIETITKNEVIEEKDVRKKCEKQSSCRREEAYEEESSFGREEAYGEESSFGREEAYGEESSFGREEAESCCRRKEARKDA